MTAWVFAIVITASMGSFVQDLFLPMFLRRPEAPKKAEAEPTERSILAMVLDDMESLQLIRPPLQVPVKRFRRELPSQSFEKSALRLGAESAAPRRM